MSDRTSDSAELRRAAIRQFLIKNSATNGVRAFEDHDSLLELGVIDSVAMLDLILHLETTYTIVIEPDEMVPENFNSVLAISGFVERKRT